MGDSHLTQKFFSFDVEIEFFFFFLYRFRITSVPITWKNARENQYPTVGQNFTVQCEVAANPAPNVDWLRNGDPVSNLSHMHGVETELIKLIC